MGCFGKKIGPISSIVRYTQVRYSSSAAVLAMSVCSYATTWVCL